MNFPTGGLADFAGYLEGNQEICNRHMSEKASPVVAGIIQPLLRACL